MDLPKFEALKLDERDFIVDPNAQNICFFPLPIFTRISEMLSPSDFVHLAQTCRYIHWRMFTYGHLMLKHNKLEITKATIKENSRIKSKIRAYGKPLSWSKIIRRPYVYIEYLHLYFNLDLYSPSIFDKVIDDVSKAKKRTKHYCIEILGSKHRLDPLHLKIWLAWNDHKLTVDIPNLKNIYSVSLLNFEDFRKTEFYMNPCARYKVFTVQDLCNIVQEFIRNSRLQFHICDIIPEIRECFAKLKKELNLKYIKINKDFKNLFCFSQSTIYSTPPYASIPSEHGDVNILFADRLIVIQRKETYIGQWIDFYRNVEPYF